MKATPFKVLGLAFKELLGLKRCRFLYGDFVKYLAEDRSRFDFAIACGVFYHLRDPQDALLLLRKRVVGPVFLWTHYWTPRIRSDYPSLWRNFRSSRRATLERGGDVELHRHEYHLSFFKKGFWGGNAQYSEWLEEKSLFAAIRNAGWRVADQKNDSNVNGPAISCILVPEG